MEKQVKVKVSILTRGISGLSFTCNWGFLCYCTLKKKRKKKEENLKSDLFYETYITEVKMMWSFILKDISY